MARFDSGRARWLVRRLSRIYPAEIPYRVGGLLRTAIQRRGWISAHDVPAPSRPSGFGAPWIGTPPGGEDAAARSAIAEADGILSSGVRIFDMVVPLMDGSPAWNTDPKTGIAIGMEFGLDIDFRHIAGGVDIKYLWELNRHLWWVPIAQAYAVTKDEKYLRALAKLLDDWLACCPYPSGPNWSSPVEHGIRLINWAIVWQLIGGEGSPLFASPDGSHLRQRWMASVYQHVRFASDNLSFYSSADNHLIGEAAGIYVATLQWNLWRELDPIQARAREILEAEILKQFSPDGVNREQAICYHRFSLEFLLAARLCGLANGDRFSAGFDQRMKSALLFLAAMLDSRGKPPAIGDSDDGKVFSLAPGFDFPYVATLAIGNRIYRMPVVDGKLASLGGSVGDPTAPCGWVVAPPLGDADAGDSAGEALPRIFRQGGYVIAGDRLDAADEFRLVFDVGPLGYNRIAGHGHADALSLLVSVAGEGYLVDPGTYCYNAAPELRRYFRGTGAHNTAMIDGEDQSVYGGSFLWLRDIATSVRSIEDDRAALTVVASHDGYRRLADPVVHTRTVSYRKETREIHVEDRFECRSTHKCELRWHFAPECRVVACDNGVEVHRAPGTLKIRSGEGGFSGRLVAAGADHPVGWVSNRFYERVPACTWILSGGISSGTVLVTRISFEPAAGAAGAPMGGHRADLV